MEVAAAVAVVAAPAPGVAVAAAVAVARFVLGEQIGERLCDEQQED